MPSIPRRGCSCCDMAARPHWGADGSAASAGQPPERDRRGTMTSPNCVLHSANSRIRLLVTIDWLSCFALVMICLAATSASAWDHWGGDQGGTRFSALDQIT